MTYNQRTMTVKLERIDVCDLLLACTALEQQTDAKKWGELHEKLLKQLDAFDEKHAYEVHIGYAGMTYYVVYKNGEEVYTGYSESEIFERFGVKVDDMKRI